MRSERGQATVEMVALVPALVVACAIAWELVLAGHTAWVAAHAAVRERSSDEPVHITPGRAAKSMRLPLSRAGARPGRATAPPEAKNPAGCGVLLRVRRASADGTAARTQEILEVYFSGGTAPLPGAGVADVPGPR